MANKEFQVRHGLVVNNNVLVANTITGNVGIGTSNPIYKLDIVGTINASNVLINGGSIAANLAPAFNTANDAYTHSNTTYAAVNSAFAVINAAFNSANNVAPQVAPAYNTANGGYTVANAAYTLANTKYSSSGGTISGNVSIVGDLNVRGNTYFVDQQTLVIGDPLIYLAGNNYTSDVVDIGFIANYVNTSSINVHTGLFRSAGTKEYYLFQGYDKEPANNYIDPTGNNITRAVLNSDIRTSNLNLAGANAVVWIRSAYDTVNAAYTSSNADYVVSNAAFTQVNTLATSANAYATAVGSSANNYAGSMANSVNTYAATVGTSTNNYTLATYSTLTQLGQNWAVTNAAFGVANTALPNTSNAVFNGNLFIKGITTGINTTDPSYTGNVNSAFTVNAGTKTGFAIGNDYQVCFAINVANTGWTMYDHGLTPGAGGWSAGISQSNGKVGIGNTAPALKLEVAGNMSVDAFVENSANITTSYTITAGRNAMTAGPVTVNSGVTVEVPSGSTWTVV